MADHEKIKALTDDDVVMLFRKLQPGRWTRMTGRQGYVRLGAFLARCSDDEFDFHLGFVKDNRESERNHGAISGNG